MKRTYKAPKMEQHVMGSVHPLCQSGGVTGDGVVGGVGYGGVDEGGTQIPSVKEIHEFCEELDKMDW